MPIRSWGSVLLRGFVATAALGSGMAYAQFCPQNFDAVTAPALPAGWSTTFSGTPVTWATTTTSPDTLPNAAFAPNQAVVTDTVLVAPATVLTASNANFFFRHRVQTEVLFDGGVLEISLNGGGFQDFLAAGGTFVSGGYTGTISAQFASPIGGRPAWTGNVPYTTVSASLPSSLFGQSVVLRWRMATDQSQGATGWTVDSIMCGVPPVVFGSWNARVDYPIPILDQGSAVIGDVLYSFGGASAGAVTASSFKFDGSAWTAIANLPSARQYPGVTTNGQYAYLVGGADSAQTILSTLTRYEPALNAYVNLAPAPTPSWNSAFVHLGGKLYKFGGSTTTGGASTANAEVYTIASNTWAPIASYPAALSFIGGFSDGAYVYGIGGLAAATATETLKTYRYDAGTNTWNDAAIADLPATRWGSAIAPYRGGALVAGGYSGNVVQADALRWSRVNNVWAPLPDMLAARARFAGSVVKGCFFAIGGRSTAGGFAGTRDNQQFDCLFDSGFDPP